MGGKVKSENHIPWIVIVNRLENAAVFLRFFVWFVYFVVSLLQFKD
jgi:hypothetical protein